MPSTVAVAPLHCLSKYRMTLATSPFDGFATPSPSAMLSCHLQLICRIVHLRPIRCTSVTPCAIVLHESSAISPADDMFATSISISWNFSSIAPAPVNLP